MLGTDLCQTLSETNYDLVGVDLRKNEDKPVAFENGLLDVTREEDVKRSIHNIKPDLVIHTAAYTAVDECEANKDLAFKVNSEGTENVAKACKEIDALMFYISTDYVFDGEKTIPYEVDDETNPLSIYGFSKLKGEVAVKDILDRYLIIRTSWLYGKYGSNFIDKIISRSKEVNEFKIVNDQTGAPTYTVDLSKALLKLIQLIGIGIFEDKNNLGIYHITNSGSCNWYEYAKEIISCAGIDVGLRSISSLELNRPAKRPKHSVLSNKRFEDLAKFNMRSWQDALSEYLTL